MVHLPDNEAGALLAMLEQFAVRGVNLSRIESRPIGDSLGRYSFSIDAEGHITDERVGEAVMGLHRRCPYVRFLGSYPRADAVEPTVHVGTADDDFVGARAWLQRACATARRPDGQTGHPHDERPGVHARGELGDPADDVAVHLHVLAALDDDAAPPARGVWSIRPILAGRSLRTPTPCIITSPNSCAQPAMPAARVDRGDVEPAVVQHARPAAA